jgi:hypothetical protein
LWCCESGVQLSMDMAYLHQFTVLNEYW